MQSYSYDLLVIGSGPAGQRAAIQAAKLNKRVALVERKAVVGGVCINTGTIPSKTLREAVLYLSGFRLRGLYGASYSVKQNITMDDLLFRTDHVIRHELDVTRHQLQRNRVEVFCATAAFVDPHTIRITDAMGDRVRILLASGKQIVTDGALYSVGRTGATASLNLAAAGLSADDRGRLAVDDHLQTSVPHIYAVGDVIGFPSLASTSM